ncbi:MAG: hypothetical protein CMM01_04285 [Rhodopirellula sp.]|nr:hypothetical protein [Rhodopirellula sp.]
MRFLLLPLLVLLVVTVELRANDFEDFGLNGLESISAAEAETIRGAGEVKARTTGSAGLTATVLDPNTGSIWNFNVTQFNQVKDSKQSGWSSGTSTILSELAVGLGDVSVSVNEFYFNIHGAGARAIGRTNAGALAPHFRRL